MKYIGNKKRLLDFIDSVIKKERLPQKGTFLDIFTGTTNVAQHYKKKGYKIITNDFMTYSYIFQSAYIKTNSYPRFNKLFSSKDFENVNQHFADKRGPLKLVIDYLNRMSGKKGFIFKHYAPGGKDKRQYFSNKNAIRIDATRDKIEEWGKDKLINNKEFNILLASLIDAADFVANIAGTYGAYLKIWRSMALKPFTIKMPELIESNINHEIYKENSNIIISKLKSNILYIDPPYNSRQYAPNFHILETLACWDNPIVNGKTGLRPYDHQKSAYSQKEKSKEAFSDLIKKARTDYILMSYNNEGIIPQKFILNVLSKKGKVKIYKKDYRRFRTEKDHENRHYKVPDDRVEEIIYFVKNNK